MLQSAPSHSTHLKELVQIWNLLGVVIDIYMVSKDHQSGMATEPVGAKGQRISGLINSWVNSSMGQPLLVRLMDHLKSKTTAVGFQLQKQVLVTALCIFGQQQLDTLLTGPDTPTIRDHSATPLVRNRFSWLTLLTLFYFILLDFT